MLSAAAATEWGIGMKRVLVYLLLVLAAAVGLLWPTVRWAMPDRAGVHDPVVIGHYEARYDIAADGHLDASEIITARFPSGRHGIFRFWDVSSPSNPGIRHTPTITAITMDGADVPFSTSEDRGPRYVVAKVGDPDRFVDAGTHVYRIDYTIDGVLDPAPTGAGHFTTTVGGAPQTRSVFYWNVVAPGWLMPIERADITITLPAAAGQVQCSALRTGDGPCVLAGSGSDTVTIAASNLAPGDPVTVRIGLDGPVPKRAMVPWPVNVDPVLGHRPAVVVLVALAALAMLAAGIAWARRSHERPPGFPVMYAPPDGLGPTQVVYVGSEGVGEKAVTSTLLHQAEQGLVRLRRDDSDNWTVVGEAAAERWASTDPVTRRLGEALGVTTPGGVFRADRSAAAGKTLSKATAELRRECRAWARRESLVVSERSEIVGKVVVVLCAALAVLGFSTAVAPTMVGLPFAALVVGGWELLRPGAGTRRTGAGRELWSRTGGFERMLSTKSSADRFHFAAQKDLYLAYIPYAVAFGVADAWADKYRAATGQEPPVPAWYPYSGTGMRGLSGSGASFDSFESALSASISSYQASQSSSGSGGGGGGGGGGGSW